MTRKAPNRVTAAAPVPAITTDADGVPAGAETDPHAAPATGATDPAPEPTGRKGKKPQTEE